MGYLTSCPAPRVPQIRGVRDLRGSLSALRQALGQGADTGARTSEALA